MRSAILFCLALAWFPDAGQLAPPAAPVVRVWTMRGCRPCEQVKADLKGMTSHDFRYRDYRTADREILPIIQKHGLPLIEWNTPSGQRHYITSERWKGYDYFRRVHARSMKP